MPSNSLYLPTAVACHFILFLFYLSSSSGGGVPWQQQGKEASLNKRLDKMIDPTPGAADSRVIGGGLGPVSLIHCLVFFVFFDSKSFLNAPFNNAP